MRRIASISAVLLLMAFGANAQVRGLGRLQGNVTDKNTGKPIAGATITITLPKGNTVPIVVKTNSNGHWSALGMTSGVWYIDISAPGYVTSKGTAPVSEAAQNPSIDKSLEPAAAAQPAANEVSAAPSVPKETVDLIKDAQATLNAKAGDVITVTNTDAAGASTAIQHTVTQDELKTNAAKAAAELEKALPQIPDTTPELKEVRGQVLQVLAQAYYRSGDVTNAISTLEKLNGVDPMPATPDAAHTTRQVLLANLYLEAGQLDKGRQLLETLPPTAISDPTAYINIGILFLNKKNPADAATYFSKAIALDAKRAESYYYRGLAEVQTKKFKEAKADFEQVLTLAPDSPEAKDAKQLLASIK